MKKLTAEKCRDLIDDLKSHKAAGFRISRAREGYLAALEIALPILEQQERGEGEWIEWKGGLDPADQYVEVKFRTGATDRDYVRRFMWKHAGDRYDIIAYRILPERDINQNDGQ